MRAYDLVLVLRPQTIEQESKKILETVKKWLGEAEVGVKELGKKSLAYPIKKENEGIYFLLNIGYSNGALVPGDLEKKLLMEDNILRHLLIRRKKVQGKKNGSKKS